MEAGRVLAVTAVVAALAAVESTNDELARRRFGYDERPIELTRGRVSSSSTSRGRESAGRDRNADLENDEHYLLASSPCSVVR